MDRLDRLAFAATKLALAPPELGPSTSFTAGTPDRALDLAPLLVNPLLSFAWTSLVPAEILERHHLQLDVDIGRDGALLRFGGRI